MMTSRENYLSIARRTGYAFVPVEFNMCPSLSAKYQDYLRDHEVYMPVGPGNIPDLPADFCSPEEFRRNYYASRQMKEGTVIDAWGIAHEPGSAAAYHMTYMHHPMETFDSEEQILSYPLPVFRPEGLAAQTAQAKALHDAGRAVIGQMQCTIWETAWYLRGMENLMCDMMSEDPMAEILLDRVTELSVQRAVSYTRAGADILFLGDDIGMQHTIMLSESLYGEWLGPRLKRVIDAARAVNPEILIFYHSCGHVAELIPQLMEAGIDVLDPVQPECNDFRAIHDRFGDRLSFHGTIGTQSVMPFGTPAEIRAKVFENLDIAGKQGGLFVCPTHLLEPEVPVENIIAYINACNDYLNR